MEECGLRPEHLCWPLRSLADDDICGKRQTLSERSQPDVGL